jgi:hypothetical protein
MAICACYSWGMAVNFGLDIPISNMQDRTGMREIAWELIVQNVMQQTMRLILYHEGMLHLYINNNWPKFKACHQ